MASTIPIFGHFIKFSFLETKPVDNLALSGEKKNTRNINDVLLSNARKLQLPEPFSEDAKITNNKRVV